MGSSASVELSHDGKYAAFLALKESYEQDKLDLLQVCWSLSSFPLSNLTSLFWFLALSMV